MTKTYIKPNTSTARLPEELHEYLAISASQSNRKITDEIRARLSHSCHTFDTVIDNERAILSKSIAIKVVDEKYVTSDLKGKK